SGGVMFMAVWFAKLMDQFMRNTIEDRLNDDICKVGKFLSQSFNLCQFTEVAHGDANDFGAVKIPQCQQRVAFLLLMLAKLFIQILKRAGGFKIILSKMFKDERFIQAQSGQTRGVESQFSESQNQI